MKFKGFCVLSCRSFSDLIGFGNQIADEVTVSTTIDKHGSSSREIAIEGVFIDQYPFKK